MISYTNNHNRRTSSKIVQAHYSKYPQNEQVYFGGKLLIYDGRIIAISNVSDHH